jgi:hypothetical protein
MDIINESELTEYLRLGNIIVRVDLKLSFSKDEYHAKKSKENETLVIQNVDFSIQFLESEYLPIAMSLSTIGTKQLRDFLTMLETKYVGQEVGISIVKEYVNSVQFI